jgi:hypothetical protein
MEKEVNVKKITVFLAIVILAAVLIVKYSDVSGEAVRTSQTVSTRTASNNGCADGSVEQVLDDNGEVVRCDGSKTGAEAESLCSEGWHLCNPDEALQKGVRSPNCNQDAWLAGLYREGCSGTSVSSSHDDYQFRCIRGGYYNSICQNKADWYHADNKRGAVCCTSREIVTPTSCTDSDGRNPNRRGAGEALGRNAAGTYSRIQHGDICASSTAVIEYYCEGNRALRETIPCSNGCSLGACLPEPRPPASVSRPTTNTCTDTDSGRDSFVYGVVNGVQGGISYRYNDLCYYQGTTPDPNNMALIEQYCEGNNRGFESVQCQYGCVNGACRRGQVLPIVSSSESCQSSERRSRNLYPPLVNVANTGWQCVYGQGGGMRLPQYVTFDLGALSSVGKINVYQTNLRSNEVKDVSILVAGSTQSFVKVAESSLNPALGSRNEIFFAPINARWVRIQVDASYGDVGIGLSKVEIYRVL